MSLSDEQLNILAKIEKYLKNGGDINGILRLRHFHPGHTPIYFAIKYKLDTLFSKLLQNPKLDIYAFIHNGFTALQVAMGFDREEYVKDILSYHNPSEPHGVERDIFYDQDPYNINALDAYSETALTTAILFQSRLQQKYVDLLLKHGATPNTVSQNGTTPLWNAINAQNNIEDSNIIKKLIDHGARILDKLYIRYDDDFGVPIRSQTYMDVFNSINGWDDMTVYRDIRRMLTPPGAAKRFSITDKGGKRRRKTKTRGNNAFSLRGQPRVRCQLPRGQPAWPCRSHL